MALTVPSLGQKAPESGLLIPGHEIYLYIVVGGCRFFFVSSCQIFPFNLFLFLSCLPWLTLSPRTLLCLFPFSFFFLFCLVYFYFVFNICCFPCGLCYLTSSYLRSCCCSLRPRNRQPSRKKASVRKVDALDGDQN